jgi:hypothetical protein
MRWCRRWRLQKRARKELDLEFLSRQSTLRALGSRSQAGIRDFCSYSGSKRSEKAIDGSSFRQEVEVTNGAILHRNPYVCPALRSRSLLQRQEPVVAKDSVGVPTLE